MCHCLSGSRNLCCRKANRTENFYLLRLYYFALWLEEDLKAWVDMPEAARSGVWDEYWSSASCNHYVKQRITNLDIIYAPSMSVEITNTDGSDTDSSTRSSLHSSSDFESGVWSKSSLESRAMPPTVWCTREGNIICN